MPRRPDQAEIDIYAQICTHEGIRAKDIAGNLGLDRKTVNHYLFSSPFMRELCYQDRQYCWHGMIQQTRPHTGLGHFAGYYSTVDHFLELDQEAWLQYLKRGCLEIGRNLNDRRGLIHSFRDSHDTMIQLFQDLRSLSEMSFGDWEILFELRLKKSRNIRIYADVMVLTSGQAFSLEFKMKDVIEPLEVQQAAKYRAYEEVIFGPGYQVIPVLVLTKARDLYRQAPVPLSKETISVCSGDMLFNVFDASLRFLHL